MGSPLPLGASRAQSAPCDAPLPPLCPETNPQDEYGVETTLEPLTFSMARWVVGGWPSVEAAGRMFNTQVAKDMWGRPVLLFR